MAETTTMTILCPKFRDEPLARPVSWAAVGVEEITLMETPDGVCTVEDVRVG
jgi:hypothetical protein